MLVFMACCLLLSILPPPLHIATQAVSFGALRVTSAKHLGLLIVARWGVLSTIPACPGRRSCGEHWPPFNDNLLACRILISYFSTFAGSPHSRKFLGVMVVITLGRKALSRKASMGTRGVPEGTKLSDGGINAPAPVLLAAGSGELSSSSWLSA